MRPQLIGIPVRRQLVVPARLRRGAAAIRAALWSPAGNSFTETGVDLLGLADGGDLALSETAAQARAQIEIGIGLVLANGFHPIALGGDHSITYPILRAVADEALVADHPAHRRARRPLRRVRGRPLLARLPVCPHHGGASGLAAGAGRHSHADAHQRDQVARFDVNCIEMRHFADGVRPPVEGPVYVSVDLDGLDPAFAPGVSHREPGGLSVRDVLR